MRTYFTPERVGEVDEPPALVELLRPRGRLLLVHAGGGAEVGDHETERREILARVRQPRAGQLRDLGEIHFARDAAQLERA